MNQPQLTPYKDALTDSMTYLGQKENKVFVIMIYSGCLFSTVIDFLMLV